MTPFLCEVMSGKGQESVRGLATPYGLDDTGIEYRWRRLFHTHPKRLLGPLNFLYNGYRVRRPVRGVIHPLSS